MPEVSYPIQKGDAKETIEVCKFEIEFEDVFHLKNLYKRVYDFLKEEGWQAAEGPDEIYETLYWERSKPNEAQDHHIWWRAYRIPEGNRFYRYFLKIDFQTLNMKKIEVMHKGQKFGTNKGDVIIRVSSFLQIDYNQEWGKSSLLSFFYPWFRQRLYLKDLDDYRKDLYAATYRINTIIKHYLQLKPTVADWGRQFHPEKGI